MVDKNLKPEMRVLITGNVLANPKIRDLVLRPWYMRHGKLLRQTSYHWKYGQSWAVQTKPGEFEVSEMDVSPIPEATFRQTQRGFQRISFEDLVGSSCSLQESSLGTEAAIWLGVDEGGHFELKGPGQLPTNIGTPPTGGRMHLRRGQVAMLLPLLQHFVDFGELPSRPPGRSDFVDSDESSGDHDG